MTELRRRNLKALIDKRFSGSQSAFRDATGISLSQIGQWLNDQIDGSRNMGEKSARRIEEACALGTGWMDQLHVGDEAAGTTAPVAKDLPAAMVELLAAKNQIAVWDEPGDLPDDEGRVWIDRYDYRCSAGDGVVQWEIRQKRALPFTSEFFKAIGSKPSDCKLGEARGDSMEPYLFNRDLIMIDTEKTFVRDGNIYAICFEGESLVKQLFRQPGGLVTLHSYNAKYPDRLVQLTEHTDFQIVGQIVYRSGAGQAAS